MIDTNIDFIIEGDTIDLVTDFGQTVTEYIRSEEYTGQTTVTPSTTQQILETADTHVSENITVESVPLGILDVTENGTYQPVDVLGFSKVNVDVQYVLEKLTVTENGTYRPETGVDGFSEVIVKDPYKDWYVDENLKFYGDLTLAIPSTTQKQFESQSGINSLHLTSEEGVTLAQYSFRNSENLRSVIIDNLTSIGGECFSYCGLDELVIKNAEGATIGGYICRGVNTGCIVKINGTPATMNSNAFKYSYRISDLYVSWSEGEVANAPWETPNTTIHYNTVFDDDMNVISSD